MYKRLDKYKEKMRNMKPAVQDTPEPIMWFRGWNDGKNGYINTKNGRLISDYIRRDLREHQRYSANISQLADESLEAVRYEINRTEFELRCIKERLRKTMHIYHELRQLSGHKLHNNMNALREKIALLQRYKKDTEQHLLEIQEELRTAEQTAEELIAVSERLLEKKFQAYINGAKRYLKDPPVQSL